NRARPGTTISSTSRVEVSIQATLPLSKAGPSASVPSAASSAATSMAGAPATAASTPAAASSTTPTASATGASASASCASPADAATAAATPTSSASAAARVRVFSPENILVFMGAAAEVCSKRTGVDFAGADADYPVERDDEHRAVAHLAGARGAGDGLEGGVERVVRHRRLDLERGQEV